MSLDEVINCKVVKGLKLGPFRAKAHNIFLKTKVTEYFFVTSEFTAADGLFCLLCGYVYDVFFQNIKIEAMRDAGSQCYEQSSEISGMIKEEERITLGEWFDSIITSFERISGIFRDLMPPPPHTEIKYSMGAVQIEATPQLHALLENRGYKASRTEIIEDIERPIPFNKQLDTLARLIQNESKSFFQLQATGEMK